MVTKREKLGGRTGARLFIRGERLGWRGSMLGKMVSNKAVRTLAECRDEATLGKKVKNCGLAFGMV